LVFVPAANIVSPFKSLPRTTIRGEMREGFYLA
jgi:hypothetical protein